MHDYLDRTTSSPYPTHRTHAAHVAHAAMQAHRALCSPQRDSNASRALARRPPRPHRRIHRPAPRCRVGPHAAQHLGQIRLQPGVHVAAAWVHTVAASEYVRLQPGTHGCRAPYRVATLGQLLPACAPLAPPAAVGRSFRGDNVDIARLHAYGHVVHVGIRRSMRRCLHACMPRTFRHDPSGR